MILANDNSDTYEELNMFIICSFIIIELVDCYSYYILFIAIRKFILLSEKYLNCQNK